MCSFVDNQWTACASNHMSCAQASENPVDIHSVISSRKLSTRSAHNLIASAVHTKLTNSTPVYTGFVHTFHSAYKNNYILRNK